MSASAIESRIFCFTGEVLYGYVPKEQKRIRARLAATSAGSNHLACLTRVVIGEATSSSWRECLDVENTFSMVIHNAKFYNFLNYKKSRHIRVTALLKPNCFISQMLFKLFLK